MKKGALISICGGLILAFATPTVLADEIPGRTLPIKILQARGYSAVKEVEFDDGLYEGF